MNRNVTGVQSVNITKFLNTVKAHIGQPYVYGGDNINATDCSGLVYYGLRAQGVTDVPRTSEEQWDWVQHIQKSQLQPGDLVFDEWGEQIAGQPGHVGIYMGNGIVLEDPHSKAFVHTLSLQAFTANQKEVGYGRIPGASNAPKNTDLGGTSASGGSGSGSGSGSASTQAAAAGSGCLMAVLLLPLIVTRVVLTRHSRRRGHDSRAGTRSSRDAEERT